METERLILRKLTMNDAEAMFENWTNDDEVCRYLTWWPHRSIEVTREILEDWVDDYSDPKTVRFGIEIKENGDLFGEIDIVKWIDGVPVLGFASSRKYWGRGYMTEAAKAMIQHVFSLGYDKLLLELDERNVGSIHLAEKLGFKFLKQEHKPCSMFKKEEINLNTYILEKQFIRE